MNDLQGKFQGGAKVGEVILGEGRVGWQGLVVKSIVSDHFAYVIIQNGYLEFVIYRRGNSGQVAVEGDWCGSANWERNGCSTLCSGCGHGQ